MIKFTEVHKTILKACLITKLRNEYTNDVYLPHLSNTHPQVELNSAVLELIQYGVVELVPGVTEKDLRRVRFTNNLYPELLRLFYQPKKYEQETTACPATDQNT